MELEFNSEATQAWVAIIGFIATLGTLAWSAYQYVETKRAEARQRRFETYHGLIKSLVEGDSKGLMLDRQLATAFELRNFPEYYEPSLRILKGLQESWPRSRLLDQIESTTWYIEVRMTGIAGKKHLWP